MKSILKDIILKFHQSDLPTIIPRNIPIPQLPKDVRKAFVFIGMRRVGKTYLMLKNMQREYSLS